MSELSASQQGASFGEHIPFTIKLSDCDNSIAHTVSIGLSGSVDTESLVNLAVDNPSNLWLRIYKDGVRIQFNNGIFYAASDAISNGSMSIPFTARYQTMNPSVLPTTGNTLYVMTYQFKYI